MIKGHGDDAYKYGKKMKANFSSNVYNKVNIEGLKTHLCKCMNEIGSYPEPEPYSLEAKLAITKDLNSKEVCVTNGATEAIYLIAQAFRGADTAILQPTFSEYADACLIHEHNVSSIFSLPDKKEAYLLPKEIQTLWLCNPNNPTGKVYDIDHLQMVIEHNPKVCFIIDQSYEFFTLAKTFSAKEAASFPNLLLLHSMTKRYAIPGLRLGYITGKAALLQRLRNHRMPWSVNQLAIQAGLYLLDNPQEAQIDLQAYLEETKRLSSNLKSLGIEVLETQTHFMLASLREGKASELKDYLVKTHEILIRDASNFEGLDERFFRIATQTPKENDLLVAAISQWIDN
ncbi:MAG: pyridoxal phosphate-dependent class II aminotransferase [Bacteroidales bacterium]|nr:pyridoxal phosphate-dependent class II aminotransferase [Bacteroidales bacterium]